MEQATGEAAPSATFPPEPHAVRAARSFVRDQLAELDRRDYSDAAALAVTELATNVVLHARTDFVVSVVPLNHTRVRVSVTDGSATLPILQAAAPAAALGRGLRLVSEVTDVWGAERVTDDDPTGPGKTVWFELGGGAGDTPAPPVGSEYEPLADLLVDAPPVPPDALVEVALRNTPLQLFGRETMRHRELMREMALIAFGEQAPASKVPAALTALAAELERFRGVGAATDAVRDRAIAEGITTMDLTYRLPPAVGPACQRLNELLDAAEEYCRAENLLTLAGTPDGVALRQWYLGEVARQIAGAPPAPWTGPLE